MGVKFKTAAELAAAGATPEQIRAEHNAAWARMEYLMRSAKDAGRELVASEQREYDAVEAVYDDLTAHLEGMQVVDRTGVVPSGGIGVGRDREDPHAKLLRPEQSFAAWRGPADRGWETAAAAEPGSDDEVRFGAMIRAMVTGRRDGLTGGERNALSEGTATAGGHLVPAPTAARFIDRVRNAARVVQAGATTVPMDSATLKVPRLTGSSAPAWRNENAAIASGDLTFDAVTLTARSMAFLVTASWELIEDATSADVVRLVEDDLSAQVALELDRVALRGTGTAPEPRGVRNTSGVTVTAFGGANGAAPTNWDYLVDAVQTVRAANFEPTAAIMAPRSDTTLAKTKDSTGAYLQPPAALASLPRLLTNQVPVNITTGTSVDTSEVYVGQWPMLYLGIRTGPMLIRLVERYADQGQVGMIVWFRGDVQLAQPAAFNVTAGVRP